MYVCEPAWFSVHHLSAVPVGARRGRRMSRNRSYSQSSQSFYRRPISSAPYSIFTFSVTQHIPVMSTFARSLVFCFLIWLSQVCSLNYPLTLPFADKLGLFSEHPPFFFSSMLLCLLPQSNPFVKFSVAKSLLFLRGWLLCFSLTILTNRNSPCLVSKWELIFSSLWLPASGGLCSSLGLVSALLENALQTESLLMCASVRACKQQSG